MKISTSRLVIGSLGALAFLVQTRGEAATSYVMPQEATSELTDLFTLDTRGGDWAYSALFTLDTRDPDSGTLSAVFTLDTRGDLLPQTPVFTLDTRDFDLLTTPTNLAATPLQTTVAKLTWDYHGTPLGFVLERRAPLGTWSDTTLSGGALRSWQDATVLSGQFYEYRMAAVCSNGVSAFSELAYIQMPSVPDAPASLQTWLTEEENVGLAWEDRSHNETGFDIWRKAGLSGSWDSLVQVDANTTNYQDNSVAPGTHYAYRVRAFNSWGFSGFCQESSITTPDTGDGCGFLLRVDETSLLFDGVAAEEHGLNEIPSRALLQGNLDAFIRSPPGNPHPVRVVLGFRDPQGRAVAQPAEVTDFYSIPGCPGVDVVASIPARFRAPESGTNTLWLEMIMARRDPVRAFMTERHTQESPMRKRLLDVVARPDGLPTTRVRMSEVSVSSGDIATVPVRLISEGNEYMLAFSVSFDEGLVWKGAALGDDARQAWLQTSQPESQRLGIGLMTPFESPFSPGSKHVLDLHFLADQSGIHEVRFQDSPLDKVILGGSSSPETTTWEDGQITVEATGWAGDIHPRPAGDGVVDMQDARLALLFALGIMPPPTDPSEFQRLDCAPVETDGDGVIDIADVVTILRYALGELPLQPACGPTGTVTTTQTEMSTQEKRGPASRFFALDAPDVVVRGDSLVLPVILDAQGDEHGFSLGLSFDPNTLAFEEVRVQGVATNGLFLPNLEGADEGNFVFGVTLPQEETFPAGSQTIATIGFSVLEGTGVSTTEVTFTQTSPASIVVGAEANPLAADYHGADIAVYSHVAASAPYPPPTAMAEVLSMHDIRISWEPAPFSTGYRLRRRIQGESTWDILTEPDDQTGVFVDTDLAAGTTCQYLLISLNPHGEESPAVSLQASTWTKLEHWRMTYFGTIANEGIAADHADPDHDGIPNLLEYQLGTDPLVPNDRPFATDVEQLFSGDRSLTVSYQLSTHAPEGISFEASYNLLDPDAWEPISLAPVSRRRKQDGDRVKLRIPEEAATNRVIFLRMKAE